ncbi:hypothetical protein GCM10028819_10120 [Spirosoma humi]
MDQHYSLEPIASAPQRAATKRLFLGIALIVLLSALPSSRLMAQTPPPSTPVAPAYPRMAGYLGVLHPLVTWHSTGTETNFDRYYVVGFPIGLNLWKTKQLGFSVEVVPLIRAENGTSRVANVLFHPGVLINLGHDYTLATRLAFETSGRYGFTPVLNKIVRKGPTNSYFVAVPLPVRFGNDHTASFTIGFQFGIVF